MVRKGHDIYKIMTSVRMMLLHFVQKNDHICPLPPLALLFYDRLATNDNGYH